MPLGISQLLATQQGISMCRLAIRLSVRDAQLSALAYSSLSQATVRLLVANGGLYRLASRDDRSNMDHMASTGSSKPPAGHIGKPFQDVVYPIELLSDSCTGRAFHDGIRRGSGRSNR